MKKPFLFALIATACAALAACQKDDSAQPSPGHFEKGQKVTLTAGMGGTDTKVIGYGDGFLWEENDRISVTVEGESSVFLLNSGAGTSSATFTGTMPESGSAFSVRYPTEGPYLSNQDYNPDGTPSGKMLATADNCTIGTGFKLKPQYSALCLQLYGTDIKVTGIGTELTDGSSGEKKTYYLNCGSGTTLSTSSTDPTKFHLIVEPGTASMSVTVTYTIDSFSTQFSTQFSTTSEKTFNPGCILPMIAREIKGGALTIDFESESSAYTDWTFSKIVSQKSGDITAHGGSCYGTTDGKSSEVHITTKSIIAKPALITFHISKITTNKTASSWEIQTSTDGKDWNTAMEHDASVDIKKGEWTEVTCDLSSYSNVYIRVTYRGTTATRAIDDLTLTFN